MADHNRMQQDPRVEDPTLYSSNTVTLNIIRFNSPDGSYAFQMIFAASPTTSHFNTGTNLGDVIIDTTTGKWYLKVGATTWTVVGSVT